MVDPALLHALVAGLNTSELVPFATSTVSTFPFGSSDQPSSSFLSALPVPNGVVHVSEDAFRAAAFPEKMSAIMNVPSESTTDCASPILLHPVGAATDVHVLFVG